MSFGSKAHVLYERGAHRCLVFSSLVQGSGIQANQFLILDGEHGAVIDPGGDLTYGPLAVEIGKQMPMKMLDYILASHQDPDIVASLGRWMTQTDAKVVVSKLWARFLPHLGAPHLGEFGSEAFAKRLIPVEDQGSVLRLGNSEILLLPAHFLHSVGNLHFYDVESRILFSGDMGSSIVKSSAHEPVDDFDAHVPSMKAFHERYMCSRKVTRLWSEMVRSLDVDMLVPQHGRPFRGRAQIARFLDWISELPCGIDLVTDRSYSLTREQREVLKKS